MVGGGTFADGFCGGDGAADGLLETGDEGEEGL